MTSSPPLGPAIEQLAHRLRNLRSCLDWVSEPAAPAIRAEFDRVFASCPKDQRPALAALLDASPEFDPPPAHAPAGTLPGPAPAAVELRLEQCVRRIAERLAERLNDMHHRIPAHLQPSEAPGGFEDLKKIIHESRQRGRVGSRLETALKSLEGSLEKLIELSAETAINWLNDRTRHLMPDEIKAGLRRANPTPAECWERYERLFSKDKEGKAGFDEETIALEFNLFLLTCVNEARRLQTEVPSR